MVKEKDEKIIVAKMIIIAILIGIVLLGVIYTVKSMNPYKGSLKIEKVDVLFSIGDFGGFDLNKTALTYGTITPGGSSSRNVIIGNEYSFPIYVKVFASGVLRQFLTTEENIILEPGESRKVPLVIRASKESGFGNYSGKLEFVFWKKE
ncbi:hypothetical protein HYW75_04970 [Candidatus Pacearchaeota archaeon]|nr:hypothetical protein [Candidatus Pacearchaeota archaeon]